nr:hypothetical protein CFP56_01225 [Quercus suber]
MTARRHGPCDASAMAGASAEHDKQIEERSARARHDAQAKSPTTREEEMHGSRALSCWRFKSSPDPRTTRSVQQRSQAMCIQVKHYNACGHLKRRSAEVLACQNQVRTGVCILWEYQTRTDLTTLCNTCFGIDEVERHNHQAMIQVGMLPEIPFVSQWPFAHKRDR